MTQLHRHDALFQSLTTTSMRSYSLVALKLVLLVEGPCVALRLLMLSSLPPSDSKQAMVLWTDALCHVIRRPEYLRAIGEEWTVRPDLRIHKRITETKDRWLHEWSGGRNESVWNGTGLGPPEKENGVVVSAYVDSRGSDVLDMCHCHLKRELIEGLGNRWEWHRCILAIIRHTSQRISPPRRHDRRRK
jgi:hypothetical protein